MQATTLVDITNGYETILSTSARQECRNDTTRKSLYNFPIQLRPGKETMKLWKRAMKKCFPLLYNISLQPQLHCWHVPVEKDHQWFYLPKQQQLF